MYVPGDGLGISPEALLEETERDVAEALTRKLAASRY